MRSIYITSPNYRRLQELLLESEQPNNGVPAREFHTGAGTQNSGH